MQPLASRRLWRPVLLSPSPRPLLLTSVRFAGPPEHDTCRGPARLCACSRNRVAPELVSECVGMVREPCRTTTASPLTIRTPVVAAPAPVLAPRHSSPREDVRAMLRAEARHRNSIQHLACVCPSVFCSFAVSRSRTDRALLLLVRAPTSKHPQRTLACLIPSAVCESTALLLQPFSKETRRSSTPSSALHASFARSHQPTSVAVSVHCPRSR